MNPMAERHPTSPSDDAARWKAVVGRDRRADGRFVYAVTSTGVYCRPSCPSRRPRRDRVRFFDDGEAAERAGFRACLRCRPRQAAVDPWIEKIRRACVYLANVDGHPSLATLAARARRQPVSPAAQLQADRRRVAARIRGSLPPAQGEAEPAAGRARDGRDARCGVRIEQPVLRAGRAQAGDVAVRLSAGRSGYEHSIRDRRFTRSDACWWRPPTAASARWRWARRAPSSSARSRASIRPRASRPTRARSRAGRRAILAHLAGRRPRLDLPLDVQATSFQWQVWQALASIPYGETRSYAEVAAAIGRPRAARAVARACATNPVALAIPCHRVVPSAGGVGGYRWGAGRKEKLLARERRT